MQLSGLVGVRVTEVTCAVGPVSSQPASWAGGQGPLSEIATAPSTVMSATIASTSASQRTGLLEILRSPPISCTPDRASTELRLVFNMICTLPAMLSSPSSPCNVSSVGLLNR